MKGTKFIASSLVAGIMLMGAGYAYWTDQTTVQNTVQTGEFKVNFENNGGYPKIFGATGEGYIAKAIVHGANTTTVTISNMYPGSNVRYETKIRNNGTIPAVFDNAAVVFDAATTPALKSKMNAQLSFTKYHNNGTAYTPSETGYAGTTTAYVPLTNFQDLLNQKLAGVRLEPGEYISFDVPKELHDLWAQYNADEGIDVSTLEQDGSCIAFDLPASVTNADLVENATAKFDIQVNWKQHNQ